MNYLRTTILLAGLDGPVHGRRLSDRRPTGAMIALVIAAAMNLFSYWNSDRMVLSMHGAQEVDHTTAPDLVDLVAGLAERAGLPMPRVFIMDNPSRTPLPPGAIRSTRRSR